MTGFRARSDPIGSPGQQELRLANGSRVAVIGGGPAGSLFSYFLIDLAVRADLSLAVDLYEPRDFSQPAPKGCNMCGGIVSESLVQTLAAEGINLPIDVVQRGIDSYLLHMDVGSVKIETPLQEMRIAAVYRGAGPRDVGKTSWLSFDQFLLDLAEKRGARLVRKRVDGIALTGGFPRLRADDGTEEQYDLVAVASGINSFAPKLLQGIPVPYTAPQGTKTLIREYRIGREAVQEALGSSMHVFLLNIPRLEFAAIIPKGDYATLCLLGKEIDRPLVDAFLNSTEVKAVFPSGWDQSQVSCQCWPRINVKGSPQPFADRFVFIGDCGVTRLYKDGIGGAYRAAKAAAAAAILHGVSEEAFRVRYLKYCRNVEADNTLGRVVFFATRWIQRMRFARRIIWRMVSREQGRKGSDRRLSRVLWDMFTGSAPYKAVLLRTAHPRFLGGLVASAIAGDPGSYGSKDAELASMDVGMTERAGALGKLYRNGETIVREGEPGDCMYVVQSGRVRVSVEKEGQEHLLRELGEGEFFGEMALFDREVRSATVRAAGEARVLTVDRSGLLRRIQDDPSLAFRIIELMSVRVRRLSSEVAELRSRVAAKRE